MSEEVSVRRCEHDFGRLTYRNHVYPICTCDMNETELADREQWFVSMVDERLSDD